MEPLPAAPRPRRVGSVVAIELGEFAHQLVTDMQLAQGNRPAGVGMAAASHLEFDASGPDVALSDVLGDGFQEPRGTKNPLRERKRTLAFLVAEVDVRSWLALGAAMARQHAVPRAHGGFVVPDAGASPVLRQLRLVGQDLELDRTIW